MPDEDPFFQPGRINSYLYAIFIKVFDELYYHIKLGMYQPCPQLIILMYQADVHSKEYKTARSIYDKEQDELNKRYSKTLSNISVREHVERLQSVLKLMYAIGSFRLNNRNPYPEEREPEEIDITSFYYNIDDVDSEIPLVKSLIDFYFNELKHQDTNRERPMSWFKTQSEIRGKSSYLFYIKYKEYESGNFARKDIDRIFKIPKEEQEIINYWIREFLPSGISTTVFAKPGMGKSNFISYVMQLILIFRPEWDIITNVPLIFSPDMHGNAVFPDYQIGRIHFIKNSSELLMKETEIGLEGRIPAVIIDEFDSALTSGQMRGEKGDNLRRYMYLERHYDVQGPLFIYHARKDIPVPMRDMNLSHDVFMITEYRNNDNGRRKRVVTNPDTWMSGMSGFKYFPVLLSLLPYHNKGTSPFDIMDVDMTWLNAHVTGTRDDALKQIRDLVPKRPWDEAYQKELKKEEARKAKEEKEREKQERMDQRRIDDQKRRMGKRF